jgi:hypothetical protein
MGSEARAELGVRLADLDEIVAAHEALTGGGRGRPAMKQGAALTRAGVVLLAASMEAFVEDLFDESAELLYPHLTRDQMGKLRENTSEKLNNASVFKTNLLYLNLGIPWVLNSIRWQKFSTSTFQKALDKLVETRGQIAHGRKPGVQLPTLKRWRTMVEKYAEKLEAVMSEHIKESTGQPTGW